ncbi:GMC oxidoreductase [Cylindrobasidium torrendii FP15055 ss-10]|uniref:GMC oxidoreductase n=1 Tax=Cylindrobasidium torrendii FP15055 ss-10 TaxID=1314674 RepID=A0A0D7B987_9AGAR|nr:GMC oxidoreductase [Cylindrobasidium torrendii FP15055 ss-10]
MASLAVFLFVQLAYAYQYTPVDDVQNAYDYVVVGGGTAGLILGNRLSQDGTQSVLVLEAGKSGDAVKARIDTPDATYFDTLTNTEYDYNYTTVSQAGLNNRPISWPRGRVLGGSSAINSMFSVRPAEPEISAWHDLISNMDGADWWTWDSLFGAMKDSETFTPPSSDLNLTYKDTAHGSDGPMQSAFSDFQTKWTPLWKPALESVGVAAFEDNGAGETWGGVVVPSFINPSNWTRSYSRSSYLDTLPSRSNLVVVPETTVTRLNFEDLSAHSVSWSADNGKNGTVQVRKEIILAAGVIASPQLLMVSGVGPADVLDGAGVDVVLDLPGVGQHIQDHLLLGLYYGTTGSDMQTLGDYNAGGQSTPAFRAAVNNAIAYVNLTMLMGADNKTSFIESAKGSANAAMSSNSTDVRTGTKALYDKTIELFEKTYTGNVELMLNVMGTNSIGFQVALQHPLSFGGLTIQSDDIRTPPLIDPAYLVHPADIVIMREGVKAARRLAASQPLAQYLETETSPGTDIQGDQDIEAWIRATAWSQFHPRGGCVMLPREQGGVVDGLLKVYGLQNVRVVDGSVFPLDMATHTQAPTIGLAEIGARILSGETPGSSSGGGADGDDNTDSDEDGSLKASPLFWFSSLLAIFVSFLL